MKLSEIREIAVDTSLRRVKSASTILEYFSYFESACLIHLVPRFSWSPKAQTLSPQKLYIVDPALEFDFHERVS